MRTHQGKINQSLMFSKECSLQFVIARVVNQPDVNQRVFMKRSKSFPSTWPVMYSFDAHIEISQPVCSFQCETTYWIIFEFVCDSFSKRVLVQNLKNEKEFELHENKRIWKTFSYPRYVCLIVNLVFCPWKKFFSRL